MIMKRSCPNLNHPLLYKQGATPPQGADEGDETGESRSRTWKPSTVIGKSPEKENSKHPSTLEVLSEELPMKFKYPMDKEPYDGTSDPKHYLDTFNNRMVLLNASDAVKCRAVTITLKKDAQKSEWSESHLKNFTTRRTLLKKFEWSESFLKLHHSKKAHKDTRVG
ncbi:hypothetical protein PIB30_006273 [Stylosanthes scabra]|uniref:Uncharacterized protein n=1 Tax=Stylosanthes scabra TaxID=79078 RepID=A0ABU6Q5E3_9FABA|nr:hypothetical protein [Stylosanthes scabra]